MGSSRNHKRGGVKGGEKGKRSLCVSALADFKKEKKKPNNFNPQTDQYYSFPF